MICIDNPGSREIIKQIPNSFVTYGIDNDADLMACNIRYNKTVTEFDVIQGSERNWTGLRLNLPGKHNVLNALAAIAVASELGVGRPAIARALANFQGIARRCHILGDICIDNKTVLLIDDYAHHPEEIAAILSAVKSGWPGRRVVVIFQPHRFTRTRDLFDEFSNILATVDVLVLLEIYSAGEPPIDGVTGDSLCRAVREKGKLNPVFVEAVADVSPVLPDLLLDQDILLILGAGNIGSLGGSLVERYAVNTHLGECADGS